MSFNTILDCFGYERIGQRKLYCAVSGNSHNSHRLVLSVKDGLRLRPPGWRFILPAMAAGRSSGLSVRCILPPLDLSFDAMLEAGGCTVQL